MFTPLPPSRRFLLLRRLWKPAVILVIGGAILALRFNELVEHGQELLALVLLIVSAGSIHLLDIYIFKSCMPCREDMKTNHDRGTNE